jgi:hypothetical protein
VNKDQSKRDKRVPQGMHTIADPKKAPGWPGKAPIIDESEITEGGAADIIVVGGGHAGVQCALSASEGGAGVIVSSLSPIRKICAGLANRSARLILIRN